MTAAAPAGRRERWWSGRWWSLAPIPGGAPGLSARRAYAEALGVYLAFFGAAVVAAVSTQAGVHITNPEGWWATGSDGVDELAQAALAVAVVVLLAGRRGRHPADIGLVAARGGGGPGLTQGIRMAAWAAAALLAGSIVTSALATGSFPFGQHSAANAVLDLTAAFNAGVVEEVVVLGFLVTTLEQAGRPRLEIAAVALVCRAAYHVYYGPGAVGILIWAAVFLWLFWRFRSIVPMMIVHFGWDTLAFLGVLSSVFAALLGLILLALVVVAVVLWLSDRSPPTVTPQTATADWGVPAAARRSTPPDGGGWGPPVGPRAR